MHGFGVFFGKELREIVRTWRIWVLPLIMVAFGVLSPVTAEVTPALLESLSEADAGIVVQIPDPTTASAYQEWMQNLAQVGLIAVVVSMAGMIARERKSGTAVLVLTKPVSRAAMVAAKVAANALLLVVAVVVGTVACWATTQLFFENVLVSELLGATALWLALAVMFAAVMSLLGVAIRSQGGATGAGLGAYLVIAVLSGWGPARDYSPAGLMSAGARLIAGQEPAVLWPVVSAFLATVVLTAAAVAVFRRKEL